MRNEAVSLEFPRKKHKPKNADVDMNRRDTVGGFDLEKPDYVSIPRDKTMVHRSSHLLVSKMLHVKGYEEVEAHEFTFETLVLAHTFPLMHFCQECRDFVMPRCVGPGGLAFRVQFHRNFRPL